MTNSFRTDLENGIAQLQLKLSAETMEQLYQYYCMVIEKNKVMNLTAVTDEHDFIIKHIIDSLSIVKIPEAAELLCRGGTVLDIGTGAGIPGMVLAAAFPACSYVLMDSLRKRLSFIDEVCGELGFHHVRTLHARAEDAAHRTDMREHFDLAVSRAVANMSVLSEYAVPFVKPEGLFVAYKSGTAGEEIQTAKRAAGILGGSIRQTACFTLPESDSERCFAIVQKIRKTPEKYPRKAGTPASEPL